MDQSPLPLRPSSLPYIGPYENHRAKALGDLNTYHAVTAAMLVKLFHDFWDIELTHEFRVCLHAILHRYFSDYEPCCARRGRHNIVAFHPLMEEIADDANEAYISPGCYLHCRYNHMYHLCPLNRECFNKMQQFLSSRGMCCKPSKQIQELKQDYSRGDHLRHLHEKYDHQKMFESFKRRVESRRNGELFCALWSTEDKKWMQHRAGRVSPVPTPPDDDPGGEKVRVFDWLDDPELEGYL